MFAVCPPFGTRASVVVALAPERIVNFAYGVVEAPTTTRSVVVESETRPTLLVFHPPPLDAPPIAIDPQEIFPDPSVCNAWPPVHEVTVPSARVLVNLPLPPKYAFPVVVAPPLMVRPPA